VIISPLSQENLGQYDSTKPNSFQLNCIKP
jgi:hypothetical protein